MNNLAMGGTELMYHELMRRLPQEYKDKFSIFNYPAYADETKKLIYWNQLSYDQQAVQFLKNPDSINKIDHFVFVSHWQSEIFRKMFNIPGYKTSVIKNACIGTYPKQPRTNKIRICYISTPWRGLQVLLRAWEILHPENAELHIFSGCKIYGDDYAEQHDKEYIHLYEKCETLPNVVYHGNIDNESLRKELASFDILAYPSTFEETSCIAVIEALTTGLRVITSNLGALPETTEGWGKMYTYLSNPELHAEKFSIILKNEMDLIHSGQLDEGLHLQKDIYTSRWNWDVRYQEWFHLLNNI